MPKNCPLGKLDSHACWECIYCFKDSCIHSEMQEKTEKPAVDDKNTFEDKLKFIEEILGVHLLNWQREALKQMDKGEPMVYMNGRATGRKVFLKAAVLLNELNEVLQQDKDNDMVNYGEFTIGD